MGFARTDGLLILNNLRRSFRAFKSASGLTIAFESGSYNLLHLYMVNGRKNKYVSRSIAGPSILSAVAR